MAYNLIGNGYRNSATTGSYSTIINGCYSLASGANSFIGNGISNSAIGDYSVVVGGISNNIVGSYNKVGFIGNGSYNKIINGSFNVITNGYSNSAVTGSYSFIGNGKYNKTAESYSTILNGVSNNISGRASSILAGTGHTLTAKNSSILGGFSITGATDDTIYAPDIRIQPGYGLWIGSGSTSTAGKARLSSGLATILTNQVTTNSLIHLTCQSVGGTQGLLSIKGITGGTGFQIKSTSGADTSFVAWLIIEPF
jgi:hypothetical protein